MIVDHIEAKPIKINHVFQCFSWILCLILTSFDDHFDTYGLFNQIGRTEINAKYRKNSQNRISVNIKKIT